MEINHDALEKKIGVSLDSIYLLYGKEQFFVEKLLSKIKKQFGERVQGINYIKIDDSNTDSLISEIQMPAFGYDKKLIVVRESKLFKAARKKKNTEQEDDSQGEEKEDVVIDSKLQKDIADYIKDNLDVIQDQVILVFVETEVNKNALYKAIEPNAYVCEVKELKVETIIDKLKGVCNLYKVNVDYQTLNYLVTECGTSFMHLMNEIRKLIEFAGPNGTITIDAVNKLSTKQLESQVFKLSDYLSSRAIDQAMSFYDELIYEGNAPQLILAVLYQHFKKMYIYKECEKNKMDIAQVLELKPQTKDFLLKTYKRQSSKFTIDEIRNIMAKFSDLDYDYKNGRIDIEIGLRSILCTYCS